MGWTAWSPGPRADPRLGWLLAPGMLAPVGGDGARPDGFVRALGVLAGSARAWGLLRDDGVPVATREPSPRGSGRAPQDLADLAGDLARGGRPSTTPGTSASSRFAHGAGRAWVVEVSGTQDWDPRADDEVLDVTSDVQLVAGASSVLGAGGRLGARRRRRPSRAGPPPTTR